MNKVELIRSMYTSLIAHPIETFTKAFLHKYDDVKKSFVLNDHVVPHTPDLASGLDKDGYMCNVTLSFTVVTKLTDEEIRKGADNMLAGMLYTIKREKKPWGDVVDLLLIFPRESFAGIITRDVGVFMSMFLEVDSD